ncbi:MAG: hypothetical protein ACTS5P_00095 [Candidatus Hodgkinia cicadicola]
MKWNEENRNVEVTKQRNKTKERTETKPKRSGARGGDKRTTKRSVELIRVKNHKWTNDRSIVYDLHKRRANAIVVSI